MENRKLELADIAMYLPYGLKVQIPKMYSGLDVAKIQSAHFGTNKVIVGIPKDGNVSYQVAKVKPILRPMTNLTKPLMIDGLESTPMERICDKYPYARVEFMYGSIYLYRDMETKCHSHEIVLQWEDYDLLNRLHFDWRHDLIGQGLAIDINTL